MIGSVIAVLAVIACSAGSPSKDASGNGGLTPTSTSASPASTEPSAEPATTAAAPSTAPSHSATPKPKPKPAAKPGTCPRTPETTGKTESAKTILHDLEYAHGVDQFKVQNEPTLHDSALGGKNPSVYVPLKMLKALAAQESGWTSNCVSSDGLGGYGTMQIQSATANDANKEFQASYSRMNPRGNILIANEWLEYLTVRFGLEYFHKDFNLLSNKTVAAVNGDGDPIRVTMREAVLAAYNTGLGQVDQNGKLHVGPVGYGYASSIEGLMAPSQPCQKSWGK
ncbi:MAG TPA: transglycosylase SLT domain-containing protein [Micromonosporaceae bacterium]